MSSIWVIEFTETSKKQLKKIDKKAANRLVFWLEERILSGANNPRLWGEPLQGNSYKDKWRYRVGDYRIICQILDNKLIVRVIELGHRRLTYE